MSEVQNSMVERCKKRRRDVLCTHTREKNSSVVLIKFVLFSFVVNLNEPSVRPNDATTTATATERISFALFALLFRVNFWPGSWRVET